MKTEPKVLVTGGTGFTGSHLVKRLLEEGYDVYFTARDKNKAKHLEDLGAKRILCDIRDREGVMKAVEGKDFVFHIAAAFQDYTMKDKDYYQINVTGTKNLLDAALYHGVKRFVHCSTVGVLGDVKEVPADENTPANPGDVYQETKYEGERTALEYYEEHKLPVVVIRPAGIYGPGDMRFLKLIKMVKNKRFVMFGKGDNLYHLTYIDDLIESFVLCATKEGVEGEVFIIAGERPITMKEFVEEISRTLDVPYPWKRVPVSPVLLLSIFCEKVCRLVNVSPPLFPRRLDPFRKNRAFSIDKAKRVLGYKPATDLRTGLKNTIQWYEKNNYL
ncbi:MAG: NAD-dependent epimerase/dehydratase family protein [Halobacteriota archaeon]